MKNPMIRVITKYTAIDEDRHHYDLDGFPDLECYFFPKQEGEEELKPATVKMMHTRTTVTISKS